MTQVPTTAQIRAQVAAVWAKAPDARFIGIRAPASVETGEALRVNDEELAVARCGSVLEMRERLAVHQGTGAPLVLLTSLEEADLGSDVIARLAKRHLFVIEPWQLVKERYSARYVDPSLVERHPWVARALLEAGSDGVYPPVPAGILEAEFAWRILFEGLVGLPGGQRDPESLIEWAAGGTTESSFSLLSQEIQEGLSQAVEDTSGPLARRIFDAALAGDKDVVAVGLVARVLYGPASRGDQTAIKATGKLESYLGGQALGEDEALDWANAAESVIERSIIRESMAAVRPLIESGDSVLHWLGASSCAHHSRFLQSGYEQRLKRFADGLSKFVDGKEEAVPESLWGAGAQALDHVLARHEKGRSEHIEMALRLTEWLALQRTGASKGPQSFAEATHTYRSHEGFTDWARTNIWDGDPLPELGNAYSLLSETVELEREKQNREFGHFFANWMEVGSHDKSLMGVEHVLDRYIVPLANDRPVLVVVIDGMGVPVFRQLQMDLMNRGWIEIAPDGESKQLPVVAAMPSVTEVCRTSLLCGQLTVGKQHQEKVAFSSHSGLMSKSEPPKPPVLFHKGELQAVGSVGLSPQVVSEISDLHRRVVGVVINAVDDHLAKGEQVRVDWSAHRIRPLEELLLVARDAGRAVVIVSDHGHVLEHETEGRSLGESDRWREVSEPPASDEVLLQGPRVLLGRENKILAPWSEKVRFGSKKNGYHGGASPQEVVVPLAAFLPMGITIEGWNEVPPDIPDWWSQPERIAPRIPVAKVQPPKDLGEQGRLFPTPEEEAESEKLPTESPSWIDELLASERLESQRSQAARTHLSDDRIKEILIALEERGGKLTRVALAKRLKVAPLRIGGILSALRRVLNVEGYPVLSVDEASDTVELNRKLLNTQFGL